ncbi:MAG TPA: SRPBCC domain-containing protein [Steroidobacteraceae bacterium]|nr:SRPBCC domain-containing protein [Steroidobacteraceae bacterium]
MSKVFARVTHSFKAKPEIVFDAWTTGSIVRQWFNPGPGETAGVAIDPRDGGSFLFVQRRGLDTVEHLGTYQEFVRPNRLVFTWDVKDVGHKSRVIVDIRATETGSEVAVAQELAPHWENYLKRTEASWTKMLQAMEKILAQ